MDPFVDSGRALSISIRYEPNNTGLVRGSILGCVHPDTELRIPYLAAERHLPNCWLRYLHLGRWHLQLRGLIPFPSIGTHRRLANLDSLVNHHTPSLFGLGSLAWAGHLVHIAHPLQMLSWRSALMPSRWLELISPGFTLRNLFGLKGTALRSS